MDKQKEILINLICERLGEAGARILRKLAASEKPLGAKELSVPAGKDPEGTVRTQIRGLRSILELFASTPQGKVQMFRVDLPKSEDGGYLLRYHPQDPEIKKFWAPYLSADKPVQIVFTEPQFFRLGEHTFVRHLDVNTRSSEELKSQCGWLPNDRLKASSHFVSSGETDAAIHLTRWFEQIGVKTEHLTAHQFAAQDITGRHVILLGNKRTFPDLAHYLEQHGGDFQIAEHEITNPDLEEKQDGRYPDVFSSDEPIHGLVSRFEVEDRDCWMTVFASNHGRFFEAAVRALLNDQSARRFWQKLGLESVANPPPSFEAVGQAVVTPFDEIRRSHTLQWVASRPKKG